MDIILLTVGKTNTPFIKEGIDEYAKRLSHYIGFRLVTLPDIKTNRNISSNIQKEKEGEAILNFLSSSDLCILLDEHGKEFTSVQFASNIEKYLSSGRKRVVFIVGGPYGFSNKVYDRADLSISFSKMTFTHEMIRLFFVEQVYRAMTILRGEPYHHE